MSDLKTQDTLLSHSRLWLFGRLMADLSINVHVYKFPLNEKEGDREDQPPNFSANNFLLNQLIAARDPKLARIFAFSYEGGFFDLARPVIFLVHGDGIDADTPDKHLEPALALLNRSPASVSRTGLPTQYGSFASTMRAWAYDRADFTVRLDAETGSFDALLLETELGGWDGPAQAGAHVRSAGAHVRAAGAHARSAGAHVRSAGALARGSRGNGD